MIAHFYLEGGVVSYINLRLEKVEQANVWRILVNSKLLTQFFPPAYGEYRGHHICKAECPHLLMRTGYCKIHKQSLQKVVNILYRRSNKCKNEL